MWKNDKVKLLKSKFLRNIHKVILKGACWETDCMTFRKHIIQNLKLIDYQLQRYLKEHWNPLLRNLSILLYDIYIIYNDIK